MMSRTNNIFSAIQNNNTQMVTRLSRDAASGNTYGVNSQDVQGLSPFSHAIKKQNFAMINALFSTGLILLDSESQTDYLGNTAIMHAVETDNLLVVQYIYFLVSHYSRKNKFFTPYPDCAVTNNQGETAIDIAKRRNKPEIVNFLEVAKSVLAAIEDREEDDQYFFDQLGFFSGDPTTHPDFNIQLRNERAEVSSASTLTSHAPRSQASTRTILVNLGNGQQVAQFSNSAPAIQPSINDESAINTLLELAIRHHQENMINLLIPFLVRRTGVSLSDIAANLMHVEPREEIPYVTNPADSSNQGKLALNKYKGKIPESLCCPISSDIMNDPIKISSGQIYDRQSLKEYFTRENNPATLPCPITRLPIFRSEVEEAFTDSETKNQIDAFIKSIVDENNQTKEVDNKKITTTTTTTQNQTNNIPSSTLTTKEVKNKNNSSGTESAQTSTVANSAKKDDKLADLREKRLNYFSRFSPAENSTTTMPVSNNTPNPKPSPS